MTNRTSWTQGRSVLHPTTSDGGSPLATMSLNQFRRYELRTIDLASAQRFYSELLGTRFWLSDVNLSPLPERARALGAPPHWLGHIYAGEPEEMAGRVVASGGQKLGQTLQGTDGLIQVSLRDPFGAVFAVSSSAESRPALAKSVKWHLHHSSNHEGAFAWYANLFGWVPAKSGDLVPESERRQLFSWGTHEEPVGSMVNSAHSPYIHPQWLFFFHVADLAHALAQVRAQSGTVIDQRQIPSGDTLAACQDSQGSAFGLYQRADA